MLIVGPMNFRIQAQMTLRSSDAAQGSVALPQESPVRRFAVEKCIRLELRRF